MLQSLRLLTCVTTTTNSTVASAAAAAAAHFGTAAPIPPHTTATNSLSPGQEPDAVDCVVVGAGTGQLGVRCSTVCLHQQPGNSQHAQMGSACWLAAASMRHLQ
jgi:hypothetical protein